MRSIRFDIFVKTSTTMALIGSLASVSIGRYLFYRTVVPLGLAGNFFVEIPFIMGIYIVMNT